jgi:Putative peptidoglycan binding domain
MAGDHLVQQGECLSNIADQYGFTDYRTIYDHPNNAALRARRPNPNLIFPGDRIYIPDLDPKHFESATDMLHKFEVKRPRTMLRVVILDEDGNPSKSAPYRLFLGDKVLDGKTGGDGLIETKIPPDLEQAKLEVKIRGTNNKTIEQRWTLKLGHLDPADKPSGIQARLQNLGYDCGEVDGIIGPKTRAAVRDFQQDAGLTVDGIAGPKTQAALKSAHGC